MLKIKEDGIISWLAITGPFGVLDESGDHHSLCGIFWASVLAAAVTCFLIILGTIAVIAAIAVPMSFFIPEFYSDNSPVDGFFQFMAVLGFFMYAFGVGVGLVNGAAWLLKRYRPAVSQGISDVVHVTPLNITREWYRAHKEKWCPMIEVDRS